MEKFTFTMPAFPTKEQVAFSKNQPPPTAPPPAKHLPKRTSNNKANGYPCGRCKKGGKFTEGAGGWQCDYCGMVFPYIGLPKERMTEDEKKSIYDMPRLCSLCDKVELIPEHGSGCVQEGGEVWQRLSLMKRCPDTGHRLAWVGS